MKRLLDILLLIAVFAFPTSCGTVYYDTIPSEVATMIIPSEGGRFEFKVVDYEIADRTRFQPGEAFKCYCYRVVEDGVAGKESDRMTGNPKFGLNLRLTTPTAQRSILSISRLLTITTM